MAMHSPISFEIMFCVEQAVTEYLVLWEGYPVEDASWVAEHDITAYAIRYHQFRINVVYMCTHHTILLVASTYNGNTVYPFTLGNTNAHSQTQGL